MITWVELKDWANPGRLEAFYCRVNYSEDGPSGVEVATFIGQGVIMDEMSDLY